MKTNKKFSSMKIKKLKIKDLEKLVKIKEKKQKDSL